MGPDSFQWCPGQDKGQRAQTGAEEAPAEPKEELLPSEGDGALAQAAQGGCGVSFLEIFQPRLDTVLCSLLWVTLLGQEVGLGDPQRSLPTPTMLGFCELQVWEQTANFVRSPVQRASLTPTYGRSAGRWGESSFSAVGGTSVLMNLNDVQDL